jgi:hypothetical protein
MNYGTPIVSIVDYNLDVRQENPSLLNLNANIVNTTSSPVIVSIVNVSSAIGAVNTIGVIGYVSNLPVVKAQILSGNLNLLGGYISSLPNIQATIISTFITVSTIPATIYDGIIINGLTITLSGNSPSFTVGGGKQIDMGIVISTVTGTSVTFSFSVVALDSVLGVSYASYNTSTFTTSGVYWLTVPAGNFLGDTARVSYTVGGTSTSLTGTYVRVVVK